MDSLSHKFSHEWEMNPAVLHSIFCDLHHLPEQEMAMLLLQGRPWTALIRSRSPSMGRRPALCLPPFPLLFLKVLLKIERESKCRTDCSHLVERDVVPKPVTVGGMSTDPSSTHFLSPLAEQRTHIPSQPVHTPAQGLAPSWFQHTESFCLEEYRNCYYQRGRVGVGET